MSSMKDVFGALKNALATGNFTLQGLVQTLQNYAGALEDAEGGGGGSSDYSETEHIVGKWIDGSTLYEKTIKYTTLNNGDYQNVVEITNEKVKEINAVFESSAGEVIRGDWVSSIFYLTAIAKAADQKFYLMTKRNTSDASWATVTMYCTIRYTKAS